MQSLGGVLASAQHKKRLSKGLSVVIHTLSVMIASKEELGMVF